MKYKWKYKKNFSADILDQLLLSRGIKEEEKEKFLSPNWDRDIYDPFLFRQMPQAINAVFKAIENDKNIVIHGDYDADGISGASLLYTTLKEIIEKSRSKAKVEVFLPDREEDGYGVAEHTVDRFITERQDLLITVDCGIANADSLDKAAAAGIDVIICDHHQLGERLPKNAIIIHPLAPKETYPNKYLCGTGVAFKLATALIAKSRERGLDFVDGWEKWLTDFVAIATVTDVMPLTGENRVLEKFGLITLNKTRRPGLRQIIALSGTELGSIDTQTIGFRIGPRLNAAGRIGKAITAFKTLTAKNQEEAERFASELEILNRERQKITELAYNEARLMIRKQKNNNVFVVWNDAWVPGVIGLVAGKITTEFGKPTFAFTKVPSGFVGSGRSAGGLHLVEAMKSCGDIFLKAGGHPEACGLTIEKEELLRIFQKRVNEYALAFFGEKEMVPILEIDAYLPFTEINKDIFEKINMLQPFGKGNPEPIFSSEGVILKADAVGKNRDHLKIKLSNTTGVNDLIGFGLGARATELPSGTVIEVAYKISINDWNGQQVLQGIIEDFVIK